MVWNEVTIAGLGKLFFIKTFQKWAVLNSKYRLTRILEPYWLLKILALAESMFPSLRRMFASLTSSSPSTSATSPSFPT